MTAQEMLDQAIVELGNLNDGDVFIVRDLFKGHVWNAQDKADRLTLGTLFLNFVRQNQNTTGKRIEVLDKNSANQQVYKLVDGFQFKPASAANSFLKTGTMQITAVSGDMMAVVIGSSGLNRHELRIRSSADIERVASVFNQVLVDWKR